MASAIHWMIGNAATKKNSLSMQVPQDDDDVGIFVPVSRLPWLAVLVRCPRLHTRIVTRQRTRHG